MAVEDHLAYRAVDAAQYAGTAIADVAEVIGRTGADSARDVETIYRRAASILDQAFGIGNQAEPIAPDTVVGRMQRAKRHAPEPQAA
jgi:hypothetical protein